MDVSLCPGVYDAPVRPYATHGYVSLRPAGFFPLPFTSNFLFCGCLGDPSLPRFLKGLRLAEEIREMHEQVGVFMSNLRRVFIRCLYFLVELSVPQGYLLLPCCAVDLGVSVNPSSACVFPQTLLEAVAPLGAIGQRCC